MRFTCRRRPRYVKSVALDLIGANNQKLKLRLKSLLDKKKSVQARSITASKLSASFITLEEGFQQFCNDLNKLQVSSLLAIAFDSGAFLRDQAIHRHQ